MATVQMEREAGSLPVAMPSPRTGLESTGIRIIQLHLNVKLQPGPKATWAGNSGQGEAPGVRIHTALGLPAPSPPSLPREGGDPPFQPNASLMNSVEDAPEV